MATLVVKPLKQLIHNIVIIQCICVLFLIIFFGVFRSKEAALAALTGGLVYILPGYFYATRLFSNVSPRAIVRIMCVFYVGEVLKLLVSVALFIVLLRLFTFPLLPYFVAYLVAALSFCIASMILMSKTVVNKPL